MTALNPIKAKYPILAKLLAGTAFDKDLEIAHGIITSGMLIEDQQARISEGGFKLLANI